MNRLVLEGVGMTSRRTRDRLVQRLISQGIDNAEVLNVMASTPRHLFLDEALAHRAYEDVALPLGYGQTLSQPYIVARMTEILLGAGKRPRRVLEIGTGSGYQTAVLAQLVDEIWSVERIKPLLDQARPRLRQLGVRNVHFQLSDGGMGWPEKAPFDGILAAAAPREVPRDLLQQLAPGGILVIPVGQDRQYLTTVIRGEQSEEFTTTTLEAVRFVPLLSGISR